MAEEVFSPVSELKRVTAYWEKHFQKRLAVFLAKHRGSVLIFTQDTNRKKIGFKLKFLKAPAESAIQETEHRHRKFLL